MVLVFFSLLIGAVVVVIAGVVSATTCRISFLNPHGRSLRGRASSQYFWIGLGLAYALWLIFLALALFEYDEEALGTSESHTPARRLAFFLLGISPFILAVCMRRGTKQEYCTQPIWQIITIFAIAFAAVWPTYKLLAVLGGF